MQGHYEENKAFGKGVFKSKEGKFFDIEFLESEANGKGFLFLANINFNVLNYRLLLLGRRL